MQNYVAGNFGKVYLADDEPLDLVGKGEEDSANAIVEGVQDALMLSVNSPIESWILDSGASFHSTSCKESLQNYIAGNFGKVYLVDDEPLNIEGKGEVQLKTVNGTV